MITQRKSFESHSRSEKILRSQSHGQTHSALDNLLEFWGACPRASCAGSWFMSFMEWMKLETVPLGQLPLRHYVYAQISWGTVCNIQLPAHKFWPWNMAASQVKCAYFFFGAAKTDLQCSLPNHAVKNLILKKHVCEIMFPNSDKSSSAFCTSVYRWNRMKYREIPEQISVG